MAQIHAANHLIDNLVGAADKDDAPFLRLLDGTILTHGALRQAVSDRAVHLASLGLEPGGRVLAQTSKRPEALVLYLAVVAAGGVYVPLNVGYTAAELEYFIDDAQPRLFAADNNDSPAVDLARRKGVRLTFLDDEVPATGDAALVERGPDDLAAILYTSGTTGRSKGAMLTHRNLVSNARALVETWRYTAQDVLIHALPIFHTHGLFVATNVTLLSGASMHFLPAFDLDKIAELLPSSSTLMGVPTFYTRMVGDDRFNSQTMGHMRLCISGSAPLLAETHAAFSAQTGLAILERYGMTETNMITSNPYEGDRRAGTVGFPLPDVRLRIAEPDDKGIGGIEVKGPNVTPGYWQNKEKTEESFTADGYFITGDLGQISDDGYVSIVGRAKDLVISGGYNIYPKEIEVEIDGLPGVQESAVFGIPHKDLGEAVTAAVVLQAAGAQDEESIIAALKDRLARFKQPRTVHLVDALPRNTMGKVQKNILRDRFGQNR